MDENKPRRRWLSFGIRDLLWAMVVVGLAVGWWQEHRKQRQDLDWWFEHLVKYHSHNVNEYKHLLEHPPYWEPAK